MAAVEATLTLNSGEKKVFSGPRTDENQQLSLTVVHESVLKVQKDINDALTEVVNRERQVATDDSTSGQQNQDDEEEEDDDDEEEDKNHSPNNGEPAAKKPKT